MTGPWVVRCRSCAEKGLPDVVGNAESYLIAGRIRRAHVKTAGYHHVTIEPEGQ